jgi:uncharacterized membrane protein YvbJ
MVICPDCGKDVTDAKFCSNCGATLKAPVEETSPIEETAEEFNDDVEVKIKEETPTDDIEANIVKKSKFCPNCGKELEIGGAFCPQCGYRFVEEKAAEMPTKFCQSCGEKINVNAEICPHCGVRVAGMHPTGEKNVLLSAILSFFFPGLGHIYLGLNMKGVSFIIAYIVSAILVLLIIGWVLILIIWIWALIDSIKCTEAINRGEFVEDKLF